jgi:hypothetical protein
MINPNRPIHNVILLPEVGRVTAEAVPFDQPGDPFSWDLINYELEEDPHTQIERFGAAIVWAATLDTERKDEPVNEFVISSIANRSLSLGRRPPSPEFLKEMAGAAGEEVMTYHAGIRTFRLGNTVIIRRPPNEKEREAFELTRAVRAETGMEGLSLIDKDHMQIRTTKDGGTFILPIGSPYSLMAARTLIRLQYDVPLGGDFEVKQLAKDVLASMTDEERALTVTRDWQRRPKNNNPLLGPVTRFLKSMARTGVIRTEGSQDYRKKHHMLLSVHSEPTEIDDARLLVPPDVESDNVDVAMLDEQARIILRMLGDSSWTQVDALETLDFIMSVHGKRALFRVSEAAGSSVAIGDIHERVRTELGIMAYGVALDNRRISGNTFTSGDVGQIRQVSGQLPIHTRVRRFGDMGTWKIK